MAESVHKINGNDDNNNNDNDNNNSSSNSRSSSSSSSSDNDNDNNENDNNKNDHEHNQKYPIQSGIPPWHTLSCVILLVAITIPNLPTIASLDDYATVETFTHCKFPNYLSLWNMGMIRLFIGSIVFSLTTYLVFVSEGWDLYANYLQHTKLQRVVIKITGVRALCAFTSFSWILLGIGFVARGLICVAFYLVEQQQLQQEQLQDGRSNNEDDDDDVTKNIMIGMFQQYILHPHTWFLRLTFIAWELAAPFAMLTSVISKYVLWPQAIKGGKPHNLAGIRNQLQHNWNSIFVLTETALLGGIPVCLHHISLATGFGVCYMLFTWITGKYYFGSPTVGPQYLYFFMDTTLGKITTYAMVGLLFAMTMLYLLFSEYATNTDCQNDHGSDCFYGDAWYCNDSADVSNLDLNTDFDDSAIHSGCDTGVHFSYSDNKWYCKDDGPKGPVDWNSFIAPGCVDLNFPQYATNDDCQNDHGEDCVFGEGCYCTDGTDVSNFDYTFDFDNNFIHSNCNDKSNRIVNQQSQDLI